MTTSKELDLEFVTKYHCRRIEKFNPPRVLKKGEVYSFMSKYSCWGQITNEKIRKSYTVSTGLRDNLKYFGNYNDAVEYARMLFKGEKL